MTPIDDEPRPWACPRPWRATVLPSSVRHLLPRDILTSEVAFFDALTARSSAAGRGAVTEQALSSVLWHAMLLRERRPVGRFGPPWESRNAPSAGGLHPLRLLVLPVGQGGVTGLYDPEVHALLANGDPRTAREVNAESVATITGMRAGTTLQIVADHTLTAACYEDADSLVLRDSGALVMTVCLVATALGLSGVPLGRSGTEVIRAAGIDAPLVGVGAIHLSTF